MARMLGRFPACAWVTRRPGPKAVRYRRHVEARQVRREYDAVLAGFDAADTGHELLALTAEKLGWPFWDFSDCRHGCNGSPGCCERCTFMCHVHEGNCPYTGCGGSNGSVYSCTCPSGCGASGCPGAD